MFYNEIVDCGRYGYAYDSGCYVIYEWFNGWMETGYSFECSEAQAREFCERYNGCNADALIVDICIL